MTNQTSIEWLFNELWETPKDKFEWCFILNKAKEMHKQEIIDAVEQFSATGTGTCYYNETFNK